MPKNELKFTTPDKGELPLLVEPMSEKQGNVDYLVQYLNENNQELKDKLIQHGAIIFRGFHCESPDLFSNAINACSFGRNYNYELCEVPRTKITEHVYSSVNLPPNYNLELHNEKSHDANYPTHVFFSCILNAEQGGITPLADAHKIWSSLPETLQDKLKRKGIKYRKFAFGNGWSGKILKKMIPYFEQSTWMYKFNSTDRAVVEKNLAKMGYQFRWTWDDNLVSEYVLPACRVHPLTGKMVWFNQVNHLNYHNNNINQYFKDIIKNPIGRFIFTRHKTSPFMADFGDGQCITKNESDIIRAAIDKHTICTPWQPGDFMVIDNYSCLHGKQPHVGERLILAGLTQYDYK